MKKKFFNMIALLLFITGMQASCNKEDSPVTSPRQPEQTPAAAGTFARGADVSWVTQMESEGLTFTDRNGVPTELMALLKKDCHVDAVRLRVWVNPASGWNNADDVLVKARRAAALGLRVMIDFHFSDSWADPGQQTVPAAWAGYDLPQMKTAVAAHVTSVLTKLKSFGITPEWVQVGNETRTGMLWPLGSGGPRSSYMSTAATIWRSIPVSSTICGNTAGSTMSSVCRSIPKRERVPCMQTNV